MMATQEPERVTCVCGNVSVIQLPPMKFSNLRCWRCPVEPKAPPNLRLVVEGEG